MTVKVDAKLELVRVKLLSEIERLQAQEPQSDKPTRIARMNALRYAVNVVDDVQERVK